VRTLALLAAAACVTGCQTAPSAAPEKPAAGMTNLEYEFAQLRELGCARPGTAPPDRTDAPPRPTSPLLPRPDQARLLDPRFRNVQPARTTMPPTTAVPATTRATPATITPVQRIGSGYMGPGGGMSRPVGSIVINPDGTTGRVLGNMIVRE